MKGTVQGGEKGRFKCTVAPIGRPAGESRELKQLDNSKVVASITGLLRMGSIETCDSGQGNLPNKPSPPENQKEFLGRRERYKNAHLIPTRREVEAARPKGPT